MILPINPTYKLICPSLIENDMEKPASGSHEDENDDEKDKNISPYCHNVDIKCDGDCFFDSVARALRQIKPSDPNINVKRLRNICEQFAKKALESSQPSWFTNHMDKEFRDERLSHRGYINNIGLTSWEASHGEKTVNVDEFVRGRAEVESRIICERYNVKLHMTETITVDGKEIQVNQCMDKNGRVSSHCNCKDEKVIRIINRGNQHFESVLNSNQSASQHSEEEFVKDNCYKNFVGAIQSNSVRDLKEMLELYPMWSLDCFKIPFGIVDSFVPIMCEKFQVYGPLSSEIHFFLVEEFGLRQLFASMANLSKEFVNENELLDVVCTSLEHYAKYAHYFLIQKGIAHHRLNHAFFMLVAKMYENWMEIRITANAQVLKSVSRKLLKKIQMFLTKLLFPLGEYAKILQMNDQLRQIRLDFLKVNEYPMKYLKNLQKHEHFDEMDRLKALYQTYHFGEFQLHLVDELKVAFAEANKQPEIECNTNSEEDNLKHYVIMKDIYVLDRILSYINLALSLELKAEDLTHIDKLVLERALQVTGECLKNTDDAPNLSEEIQEKLNKTGVKVDTLSELRNLLSHYSTKQAFSEANNNEMDILLGSVQADLQKVKVVIAKIARQLKIRQIQVLLEETHFNVSNSKTNNKEAVKQIQSLLDDVKKDAPSQDLKVAFEVMLNILKKHTNEELGDIKTSVLELLFVILPEVILQPLKTQDQEIWINSALFQKMNNEKLTFSDNDWLDSNSVITRISSLKLIDKYKQAKLGTKDDSLNSYGLTLTDLFIMVLSENLFSNKQLKAKTKKLKYGFQLDLNTNVLEKLGIQNTFLQNALSIINTSISEHQLNNSLRNFLKGSESRDSLFKLMNVKENQKEAFQCLLNEFRLQFTRISRPIEILDNILLTSVSAMENQLTDADFTKINLELKNKKATHITKTKLAVLCGGVKKVSKETFLKLVENCDVEKTKWDDCYSNRKSCKTVIDRVKDSYGNLLNATGKDLKGMKQCFNSYTDCLKIDSESATNALKKVIEGVIEEHFEKQFHETIIIMQNLKQGIKKHDEKAVKDNGSSHFINKKRMMAAMEMIILQAMNIISAISTPEMFKKLEKLIHVTIGHYFGNCPNHFSLRNYLAHGDAIIEMQNASLWEYLNCIADFLVQHGRAIIAINRITNDSINSSVLLTFLSIPSLNRILDQNPALYGREMEILTQSEYWKNKSWKASLLNLIREETDVAVKQHPNVNYSDFVKLIREEICTCVSFGDFNSIQFYLNRSFLCQPEKVNQLNLLHYAAENGSLDVIHLLLERDFKINATDEMNCTPLHLAVLNQRTEAAQVLLDSEADVGAKDNNGYTPLHTASYLGNTDLVPRLIKSGANVNDASKFGVSPLLLATWNCHYDATVALINEGALVNMANDLSMTPLFCAAAKGQCKIIELLLSQGAEIDGHPDCTWSPLQVATIVQHQHVVKLLIDRGANINFTNDDSLTPLHYASTVDIAKTLLNAGANVNFLSKYGTPLHTAAHEGCAEVVKLLVENGASIDAPNKDGLMAIHFMAFKGDAEMMQVLIHAGARVDIVADSTANKFKQVTPLHLACSYRQLKTVSLLLQHGANVNAICFETETNKNRKQSCWPLQFAIRNGNIEIVDTLLEHGADVNLKGDMDSTALHFAAAKGSPYVVQQLLSKGADVNAVDKNKMTPIVFASLSGLCDIIELLMKRGADVQHKVRGDTLLHVAVQRGHLNAAKLLLKSGINVNAKGVHSKTALHWACAVWDSDNVITTDKHAKLEMVQMLLENKADPNAANFIRDTPLHIAANRGDPEVVEALLKFGANINARNLTNVRDLPVTPLQAAKRMGHTDCFNIMKYWESKLATAPRRDVIADPINNTMVISRCVDCNEQLTTSTRTWLSKLCKAIIFGENVNVIEQLLADKNTSASVNLNNYQLLHICTAKNDFNLMRTLLKHGLDINHLSIEGLSPLHLAVKIKCPQAARMLLRFGADVNTLTRVEKQSTVHLAVQNEDIDILLILLETGDVDIELRNINDETPLILACQNGTVDVVKLLIKHNARINQDDSNRDAAIHAAVKNNQTSIVEILLSNSANARAAGKGGNHPLHYCMHNDNLRIAQMLITNGATVNCVNDENRTPLHLAVQIGNESSVEFLLFLQDVKVDGVAASTDTPLHLAVATGNLEITKRLIAKNSNINAQNRENQTALHLAAIKGDRAMVASLLQKGAEIHVTDNNNCAPLFLAVKHAHNCITELLLHRGANANAVCEGDWTVLHMAVRTFDAAIVALVLDHGADIHCTRNNGWTPLHFAVSEDSLAIVALLIERGANVNKADKANEMPIHIACYSGYYDTAEKLIAAGADVNCFNEEEFTPLYMAVEQGRRDIINLLLASRADVNLASSNAQLCAMDAAILNLDFQTVNTLIEKGADVTIKSKSGVTFMHSAACYGSREILDILVRHGLSIHVRTVDDATPLHAAVERGNINCVRFLVDAGADVNAIMMNDNSAPPLCVAVQNEYEAIAMALVEMGADVNLANAYGDSPLMYAAQKGMPDVVRCLINEGANVNATNNDSHTALHLAIKSNDSEAAQHLLKNGANVDVQLDNGETLLHFAVSRGGSAQIVKLLLQFGLRVNAATNGGVTPLHLASKQGLSKAVAILLENGADVNAATNSNRTSLHNVVTGEAGFTYQEDDSEKTRQRENFLQTAKNLIAKGATVDATDKNNITPLYMAAYCGNMKFVNMLLQYGADTTVLTKMSSSMLHAAAFGGQISIATLVLEHLSNDLDVTKYIDAKDQNGQTPLMRAAIGGRLDTAQFLLMIGANVNIVDKTKYSVLGIAAKIGFTNLVSILLDYGAAVDGNDEKHPPLHNAAFHGHVDIIKILLNYGVKVDQKDKSELSSLYLAARKGNLEAVAALLQHGASATERIKNSTVLHAAAYSGNAEIIKLIESHLQTEPDYDKYLNAKDSEGETPLMWASKMGHLMGIKVFLQCKVDDSIRNDNGMNALDWAMKNGHDDVATLLVNHKH